MTLLSTQTNRIQCMMIQSLTALMYESSYIKSECLQEKKPIYRNQIALSLVTLIPEASYSSPSSFDSACTLMKRTRAIKMSAARR